MKKWLAVLLCGLAVLICTAALADVTVNEKHFPDMHFREYVRDTHDWDQNGVLDASEIKAVEKIEIEDKETKSLTGIGVFTNLRTLYCLSCKIERLDLSNNTALVDVNCYACRNLTNIEVRGCKSLKYLDCSSCKLKNVDVSKNTALMQLTCSFNQLKKLDVSKNTELMYLSCSDNKLEKLDISHNTKLLGLYCSNNTISDLHLEKLLSLNDLVCSYNRLRSLNIKSNKKLETLECEHNNFKSLDLQHNAYLIDTLIDMPLYKKDGVKSFCYNLNEEIFISVDDDVDLIAPVAFIDNLRYELKGKEAAVCYEDDSARKKRIIPDTIRYKGRTYKVTEIQRYAFTNHWKLKELVIGKNVSKIGINAFSNCKNLKKITIKTTKLTNRTIGASSFKDIYRKAVFICPAGKLKDYKIWLVKVGGAPGTCTFRK